MQKRFITILVVLSLILNVPAIGNAQEISLIPKSDIQTYYNIAVETLSDYYEKVYSNVHLSSLSGTLKSRVLQDYVEAKIAAKRFISKSINSTVENLSLSYNLLDYSVTDDVLTLAVVARATYNYTDLKDIESGFGELSYFSFDLSNERTKETISDWFMPYDSYDVSMRGENELRPEESLGYALLLKQVEYQRTLEVQVLDMLDSVEEVFGQRGINSANSSNVTARASLDKEEIAKYATNYCRSSTPPSGGSDVPYYDFSKLSGNYDCTNFVSHAILRGGAKPYKPSGNSGISSTGWYYNSLNDRSSSWSGVQNLYSFLTTNSGRGPYGDSFTYIPSHTVNYVPGDILQHHNGSIWRHSTIIVGTYTVNPALDGAIVCGRTSSSSYNYNKKAEEIYTGYSKRVIRLNGYTS